MSVKLTHVIEFVADMDRAVKFYRDVIGLPLKFQSPGWSEFDTGGTGLALHPASEGKPAGSVELGFDAGDLVKFHQHLDQMHGPLAAAHAQFDHFSGLLPANLAVNETIGNRLGKMQKIE